MGMAPYGEPQFVDELEQVFHAYDDGSFWLDASYFSYHYSNRKAYTAKLSDLLGIEPRKKNERFWTQDDPDATEADRTRSRRYADIAASVQDITERAIVALAREAHRRTGSTNLCLAGGVALNALANRRILEETEVERLFIPPVPGDSGGALGAALHVEHLVLGTGPARPARARLLGRRVLGGGDRPRAPRRAPGIAYRHVDDEDALREATVDALVAGDAVGWFQGRFEFGPRALGNRSILADPRQADDEGPDQREDQVPRAVPAFRAGRARGALPAR